MADWWKIGKTLRLLSHVSVKSQRQTVRPSQQLPPLTSLPHPRHTRENGNPEKQV